MGRVSVLTEAIQATTLKTVRSREDLDYLNLTGFTGMHAQGYTGQGVKVAVIDTGINDQHERFADSTIHKESSTYYGTGADDNGHGTHCAGTIVDIAPDVELIIIKALDYFGGGTNIQQVAESVIRGIDRAVMLGANIISMSLGFRGEHLEVVGMLELLHKAVQRAVNSDVAVIVSCGNDADADWETYPGFFPEVISVGAVDEWFAPAYFTSVSEEVDVCQVGVDVWSAAHSQNDGYVKMSGTSMACPAVAGIAALIASKYEAVQGKSITEPLLYEMLKFHAVDMSEPGWDILTGAGLVTLKSAIQTFYYPYGSDVVHINGTVLSIPQGITTVTAANGETKSVLAVREDNEQRGNSVTWKPDGVTIRG